MTRRRTHVRLTQPPPLGVQLAFIFTLTLAAVGIAIALVIGVTA